MASRSDATVVDAAGIDVRVSSPQRIVFPAADDRAPVAKLDVVRHYLLVGERLLAQLRDRPTTLERWPEGVYPDGGPDRGESFTMKHLPAKGVPGHVAGVQVTFPSGRTGTELRPRSLADIAWAAQMGTITFHPWPVTAPDVDHPDTLRLDFDPSGSTGFADAVRAALLGRELLDEWGWPSFAKTSGGRGVHVYVPIEPRWDFVDVRHAAIAIGRELARREPDLLTMSWWREERGDRVFLDFNQAARDRVMASAYSLRPNPRATMSTPVPWSRLPEIDPAQFTIHSAAETLAEADPWAAFDEMRADLAPALDAWQRDLDAGEGELPYPPDFPKMPGEPPRVQPSRRKAPNG